MHLHLSHTDLVVSEDGLSYTLCCSRGSSPKLTIGPPLGAHGVAESIFGVIGLVDFPLGKGRKEQKKENAITFFPLLLFVKSPL